MKVIKWLCFWSCSIFLFSCSNTFLKPSDFVEWVKNEENGLFKEKDIQVVKVAAQYKPVEYVIANEMRTNDIQEELFEKRKEELEGLQYFNIQISINQPNYDVTNYNVFNEQDKEKRLKYLSFGLQNDIHLVEGQDTLPCLLYHFERSYDVKPHRTFVVAFDNTKNNVKEDIKKKMDKTIVIDSPIFNTGPIKLKFKKEDLYKLPSIKLKG